MNSSSSKNGMLYFSEGSGGEWILVGIADPASIDDDETRAAFTPKDGYWYVIGAASERNNSDKPISMGKIGIEGASLTFIPFSDMGYSGETFTGSFGDGFLIIDRIPGKSYSGLRVDEGYSYEFNSPDDPWGTGGGLPDIPGGPDTDASNGASSVSFSPGKHVTDVIIIDKPTAKTAYEGYPVDLT
ncbi:MAG: hypothetical protein LBH07_02720, partial [Treponema sp.]|nr:hypothetical protein [Treponema sp.]